MFLKLLYIVNISASITSWCERGGGGQNSPLNIPLSNIIAVTVKSIFLSQILFNKYSSKMYIKI